MELSPAESVVQAGTFLYDGQVVCDLRIVLSPVRRGTGGRKNSARQRIAAENPGDANFEGAYRCAFTITSSKYEKCMADIDKFAEAIAERLGAHFVVSRQLERTLMTNSSTGLRKFALDWDGGSACSSWPQPALGRPRLLGRLAWIEWQRNREELNDWRRPDSL